VNDSDQRRLAAIMIADVVGYSRLMAADELGTLNAVRRARSQIVDPILRQYAGRIVKEMGDGLLIEFASAINATKAALALQRKLIEIATEIPAHQRIMMRIGLHLGDVIGAGSDIYGDGINVAARLESHAKPGTICISANLYDAVSDKLMLNAIDLGKIDFKNIGRAIRAYEISPIDPPTAPQGSPPEKKRYQTSIAVLPFANYSQSVDYDHLADGLTEDLITELSRYRFLGVISRSTMFTYKGRPVSASNIGREVNAEFVVEGSIRPVGSKIRTTVQLIDAETGVHAWADKADREATDFAEQQDEVIARVVARLSYGLLKAAAEREATKHSTQASAYGYLLRAELAWRNGDEKGAQQYAQQALKYDPNYAPALAELAYFFAYSRFTGSIELSDIEIGSRVEQFAQRALAADRSDPFVLMAVATAYNLSGKPQAALQLLDLAAAQNSKDHDILFEQGYALTLMGNHKEGLKCIEEAQRLEQRITAGYCMTISEALYCVRDYVGALEALDRVIDPPGLVFMLRAALLGQLGQLDRAKEAIAIACKMLPPTISPKEFVRRAIKLYAQEEDRRHWLEGFGKAGVQV
jgi:adenylate cyclase